MLRNTSRLFRTWPTEAWASELLKKDYSSLRALPANIPSFQDYIQSSSAQVHATHGALDDNAQKVYIETYGCQMNGNDTGAYTVMLLLLDSYLDVQMRWQHGGEAANCRDSFGDSEAAWLCENAQPGGSQCVAAQHLLYQGES